MHIYLTQTHKHKHKHTRTNRVFGRMKKNRSNDESEGKRKRRPIRVNIVSPRNLQKVPTENRKRDVKRTREQHLTSFYCCSRRDPVKESTLSRANSDPPRGSSATMPARDLLLLLPTRKSRSWMCTTEKMRNQTCRCNWPRNYRKKTA